MLLYLIRHADALDLTPDAERPLSARGREQVRTLAKFLARSEAFQPSEMWHSTLLRAQETTDLLTEGLKLKVTRRAMAGLEPEADPHVIARKAGAVRHDLALVGHEPHLSTLATLLVAGRIDPPAFVMKKCTVLALERDDAGWLVRWQIPPQVLG